MNSKTFAFVPRHLARHLVAIAASALAAGSAQAALIDVQGCQYGPPFDTDHFEKCISDIVTGLNGRLDQDLKHLRKEIEESEAYARTTAELSAVRAARSLNLDDLHQCLADRGAVAVWLDWVARAGNDPSSLMPTIRDHIRQHAQAALQDGAADMLRTLLAQPMSPAPEQVVAAARNALRRAADAIPELGCALDQVTLPVPQFDAQVLGMNAAISLDQQQLFNDQLSNILSGAVYRLVAAQLSEALKDSQGPVSHLLGGAMREAGIDIDEIVNRAYVKHMLLPRQAAGTVAIRSYADALNAQDLVSAQARAAAAEAILRADPQGQSPFLIDIGASVLADLGGLLIKGNFLPHGVGGGDLYDLAIVALRSAPNLANYGEVALAGLVPEIGGVTVGSPIYAVAELQELAELMAKPQFKAASLGAVNLAWREFTGALRDALIKGGGPKVMNAVLNNPRFKPFRKVAESFTVEVALKFANAQIVQLAHSQTERDKATADLVQASLPR